MFWILFNEKISPDGERAYNHKKDYYGFFPEKFLQNDSEAIKFIELPKVDSLIASYDLGYFVGISGVHYSELEIKRPIEHSNMIYGGLTNYDYNFLYGMYNAGKPVILESNLFAPPTSSHIKSKVEALSGIYWSGWREKHFESLEKRNNKSDVPLWIIGEWEF